MSFAYDRIVRIQVSYSITGNRLTCNMHYGANTVLDIDDPDALVNAWETAVLPVWQLAVSQQVTFQKIYGNAIKPGTAWAGQDQLNNKLGLFTNFALPGNTCLVMRYRQYEASSRHNARLFISGVCESQLVDGYFSAGNMTGVFKDLADSLKGNLTLGSGTVFTPVCLYRPAGSPPADPVGYQVVSVEPTYSPGTQRRRMTEQQSYS